MSRQLKIELPDEVFQPLAEAAKCAGQSVEQWAANQLHSSATTCGERTRGLERLLAHAGAVDLGKPTGAENESIDADLAWEYCAPHDAAG